MRSKIASTILIALFAIGTVRCDNLGEILKDTRFSGGLLKPVAEYLARQNARESVTRCVSDILYWQLSFVNVWALKMHDANGKLPPGILTGNINTLGQFGECLSVEAEVNVQRKIQGKYCFAQLPLSALLPSNQTGTRYARPHMPDALGRVGNAQQDGTINFNWAVCFPASCNAEEIQRLIRNTLENAGIKPPSVVKVPEALCHVKKAVVLSGGAIACITISSIFATLMLISTVYDLYSRKMKRGSGKIHQLLISFSTFTNSKKLFKVNKSASTLRSVHGIRVFSLLWVMIGHRYSTVVSFSSLNTTDMVTWLNTYGAMVIVAGSVAVDTFFVLSGLLLSYVFFKQHHNKKSFNPLMFYFHRLVRLWPAMAATVLGYATIYEYVGDGPNWPLMKIGFIDTCKEYWWTALLFVQNYVNPLNVCVGQLWYISIDMQLYILSPILLYPLLKNTKFGIVNMIFWLIVAQAINASIVYTSNWPATIFDPSADANDYQTNYYQPTHMRATPWVVGFIAGYVLYRTSNKKFEMNKILVVICWLIALATMAAIVFGFKSFHEEGHETNLAQDGTFNAFARTAWGVAVIWVIFACMHGYGWVINWFLSLRVWEILSRFTYSMYLLHFAMQFWQAASLKVTSEFSHLSLIYLFLGDILLTFLFSYIWILAFESPFLGIEKALLTKNNSSSSQIKNLDAAIIESKQVKNENDKL